MTPATETHETCSPCPSTGTTRVRELTVSQLLLGGPTVPQQLCPPIEGQPKGEPQSNLEFRLQCRVGTDNLPTPPIVHGGELLGVRAGHKHGEGIVFSPAGRYWFSRPIRPDRRSNYSVLIKDRMSGRRQRISLRAPRLDEALRNLADLRALLESGSSSRGPRPALMDALGSWVESLRGRVRQATLISAESWSRRWLKNLPGNLNQITEDYLTAYFAERRKGYALSTLSSELHMLRWFWGWALAEKLVTDNPTKKLHTPPVPETPKRILTPQEWAKVFPILDQEPAFGALIRVAVYTGLRLRTLLELRWGMLTNSDTWLTIPAEFLKSGREFHAPLFPEAVRAIRSLRQTRPPQDGDERVFLHYDRTSVGRKWDSACVRAGVVRTKFHALRAMFVTECRRRGIQLEVAMRLSDHSDVRTFVRVYRQVQDTDLELAVRGGVENEEKTGGEENWGSGI
jgi:integrase/recombinase XerD